MISFKPKAIKAICKTICGYHATFATGEKKVTLMNMQRCPVNIAVTCLRYAFVISAPNKKGPPRKERKRTAVILDHQFAITLPPSTFQYDMAMCMNFGNGGSGPNQSCAEPGSSIPIEKKPNMAKRNAQNFLSKSALPPAAFTVGSEFPAAAVEFATTNLALFLLFTNKVALSATSFSTGENKEEEEEEELFPADEAILTGPPLRMETFLVALKFSTRDRDPRTADDDEDVNANIIIMYALKFCEFCCCCCV